jgi:iduronate 2-sulfatase
MGYSLCTERWRYTAWLPRETPGAAPAATELYDLARPGGESRNLAHQPEHAELVADLDRQLRAGWRAALPTPIPPP